MNVIHWGQAKRLPEFKQESYYDVSFFEVPFEGTYSWGAMTNALQRKLGSQSFGKFGGGTTYSVEGEVRPGVIKVSASYAIGD